MNKSAKVLEIFSSIQGEGLFVGERQIFIRFAKCNLIPRCDYCDVKNLDNGKIITVSKIVSYLNKLRARKFKSSVSLTGGEPLLYSDFLQELIFEIKKLGLKIYLETNGILFTELKKIKNIINFVSMDIKLPSSCNKDYWIEHNLFLEELHKSKILPGNYFVKIVLTSKTKFEEIEKSISIIKNISKNIPLILQPVTKIKEVKPLDKKRIFYYNDYAKRYLNTVRVIPQIHKILSIP